MNILNLYRCTMFVGLLILSTILNWVLLKENQILKAKCENLESAIGFKSSKELS